MGVYNLLTVGVVCPACGEHAAVECQLHVGASADGDASGRFCFREYRLGQPLAWWSPDHKLFGTWREEPGRANEDGSVEELAYGACSACGAGLEVWVRVRDLTPEAVLSATVERPLQPPGAA